MGHGGAEADGKKGKREKAGTCRISGYSPWLGTCKLGYAAPSVSFSGEKNPLFMILPVTFGQNSSYMMEMGQNTQSSN